jgi:hypothetical protein
MDNHDRQVEHERMVQTVARTLMKKGYVDIRAVLPGFDEPNMRTWPGTDKGYVPDVTAHGTHFFIFEVETEDSIRGEFTEDRWALFAHFAKKRHSTFWVVVPRGCREEARQRMARIGIEAKIWEVEPSTADSMARR